LAVHIRLMRIGKRKRPYYRIVVSDQRNARGSAYLESLGYYHPMEKDCPTKIDLEKFSDWIGKGAQPTLIVQNIVNKIKKAGASN